jgi:hypothetical protein
LLLSRFFQPAPFPDDWLKEISEIDNNESKCCTFSGGVDIGGRT